MQHPPERVADYPRPPSLTLMQGPVIVQLGQERIACSERYIRVCETYHPPTIYLPPESFSAGTRHPASGRPSFCEWKGLASYWDLSCSDGSQRRSRIAWSYPNPTAAFRELANWIALYPGQVDGCWLEGERVLPQPGNFYGGWITSWTLGPFKGDPAHPELI